MRAKGEPCPHCKRPITVRVAAMLKGKEKRASVGPNRLAALQESNDGWCAICPLPIREVGKARKGIFTCGRAHCVEEWQRLCRMDRRERLKQHRRSA